MKNTQKKIKQPAPSIIELRTTAEEYLENPALDTGLAAILTDWLARNPPPKEMPKLTERQDEIFQFVVSCIRGKQYSPTVREIGSKFGIRSPNGVMCHLKALSKKGLLVQLGEHMARGWVIAPGY